MSVEERITAGSGGFTSSNIPSEKYYDIYNTVASAKIYTNRILGDTTGEMGPYEDNNGRNMSSWHQDSGFSIVSGMYRRGGNYGLGYFCGMFGFGYTSVEDIHTSFRIVLAI